MLVKHFVAESRQKHVVKVQLSNEHWSEKNDSFGSKSASHEVSSLAVGPSEKDFMTKGMANRDKVLANLRVRRLPRSPKFQEGRRGFPPIAVVHLFEVRSCVFIRFICPLVPMFVNWLIWNYIFSLFSLSYITLDLSYSSQDR